MKKSYIGTAFIILIFGIYAVPKIIDRIKNGDVVKNSELDITNTNKGVRSDLFTIGKVPSFSLTDQNKNTITDKSYLGKVYLVEFFFSTCPTICPIMNKNMKVIHERFGANPNFGIASVTINPENDTPEVLKKHAEDIKAIGNNWHFLTGNQEYIYSLANKGFNLFAGKNGKVAGGFEHSGLFALVDKDGMIRCRKDEFGNPIIYYDGIDNKGVIEIQEDIKKLLAE